MGITAGPATAEIIRADRAEAARVDYEQIAPMKAEAAQMLAAAEKAYATERAKWALEGQRVGIQEAERLLGEAEKAVRLLVDELEQEIALLAVSIAERIVGTFREEDMVVRAAQNAIGDLRGEDQATLYIAPRYLAAMRGRLAQIGHALEVEGRPSLEPDGCTIVTARGTIDVGIRRQFDVVRQSVRRWAHKEAEA